MKPIQRFHAAEGAGRYQSERSVQLRELLTRCVDRDPEACRGAAEIARHGRHGRMAWQRRHGYGKRSLVETAFSRIKTINDGRLTSRTFGSQQNEIAVHIKIANRNMLIARPVSERVR